MNVMDLPVLCQDCPNREELMLNIMLAELKKINQKLSQIASRLDGASEEMLKDSPLDML